MLPLFAADVGLPDGGLLVSYVFSQDEAPSSACFGITLHLDDGIRSQVLVLGEGPLPALPRSPAPRWSMLWIDWVESPVTP